MAGLKFRPSTSDPCSYLVSVGRVPTLTTPRAVGALTTRNDDAPGCRGQDVLHFARKYSGRRFGNSKAQEEKFAHVGMEMHQAAAFLAHSTRRKFADAPSTLPTTPEFAGVATTPLVDGGDSDAST